MNYNPYQDKQETLSVDFTDLIAYKDVYVLPEYLSFLRYVEYLQLRMVRLEEGESQTYLVHYETKDSFALADICLFELAGHNPYNPEDLHPPQRMHLLLSTTPKQITWEPLIS